jgi:ubiquinone/menaquinone biosynthesis C-methylase UbiE
MVNEWSSVMKPDLPQNYVPALRFSWLTKIYDPIVRWTTRESLFKKRLVAKSGLQSGARVLDLACGTGTLALLIKNQYPDVEVIGIDGDENILGIARSKMDNDTARIQFDQGFATEMPYAEAEFDRVFSTLFFHHLNDQDKQVVFSETYRTLKIGGVLYIADWGRPNNILMRLFFYIVQLLDGFTNTRANVEGRLPKYIRDAGFKNVEVFNSINTLLGTLCLIRAEK